MNIELLKPHTHAGVRIEPGSRMDVDEASAHWLIEAGVAKATDTLDEQISKPQPTTRKGD